AQALSSEWSNTYGPFVGNSVVQTNDGGYALGGQTRSLGSYQSRGGYSYVNYTGLLIKVDSSGRGQWSKTYLTTGLYSIRNLVQTIDSGYALIGANGYLASGDQAIALVKVDSGGNVQWFHTFPGNAYSLSPLIALTSDNGFVLASSEQTQNSVNNNAQVLKIDQTGTLKWNATFKEDIGSVTSVIAADDGSVLVTYQVNKSAALASVDLAGHIQWTQTYPDSWLTPYSIAKSSQEGYLLLGTRQVSTNFQQIPWMVKTDANGNLEWQEAIVANSGEFNEAIPTSDGGFVLLQDNLWVIKIDSSSNLRWSGKLSLPLYNPPNVIAYSILVGANNSLIVGGQSGNEVWLAKYSVSSMTNTPVPLNTLPTLTIVAAISTVITVAAVVIAYGYRKRRSPKD
ncbi:MAG: hypothetical protein ACXV2C_05580, partial [Candidatus Bathyarchaeia archaeon]